MDQLTVALRASNNRLTVPRQQVFRALKNAPQPLSLSQLHSACEGVERTSVYRTLELFHRLGVIEIIHIGWKKRYELASPYRPHHHHLQCTSCATLVDINTPQLERLVHAIAAQQGFTLTGHHLELSGICPKCQK